MKKTARTHDDIRSKILESATRTIDSEGYSALNARKLAKAADCSVGTLYNVFGDLDGITYAVNLGTIRKLRGQMRDAVTDSMDTAGERLHAMADAYFDFAVAHQNRWEALFRFRPRGEVDGTVGQEADALFALLRDSVDIRVEDDALLALWAAVHGVVELASQKHLIYYSSGSERHYIHLIVETALRGFTANSSSR